MQGVDGELQGTYWNTGAKPGLISGVIGLVCHYINSEGFIQISKFARKGKTTDLLTPCIDEKSWVRSFTCSEDVCLT